MTTVAASPTTAPPSYGDHAWNLVSDSLDSAGAFLSDALNARILKAVAIPLSILAARVFFPYLILDPTTTVISVICATTVNMVVLAIGHHILRGFWATHGPENEGEPSALIGRVQTAEEQPKDVVDANNKRDEAFKAYNQALKDLESAISEVKDAAKKKESANQGKEEARDALNKSCGVNEYQINKYAKKRISSIREMVEALKGLDVYNNIAASVKHVLENLKNTGNAAQDTLGHSQEVLKENFSLSIQKLEQGLHDAIWNLYLTEENAPRPKFVNREILKTFRLPQGVLEKDLVMGFTPTPIFMNAEMEKGEIGIDSKIHALQSELQDTNQQLAANHMAQRDKEELESLRASHAALDSQAAAKLTASNAICLEILKARNTLKQTTEEYERTRQTLDEFETVGIPEQTPVPGVHPWRFLPKQLLLELQKPAAATRSRYQSKIHTHITALNTVIDPLRQHITAHINSLYQLGAHFADNYHAIGSKPTEEAPQITPLREKALTRGILQSKLSKEHIAWVHMFFDELREQTNILYTDLMKGLALPQRLPSSYLVTIPLPVWNDDYFRLSKEQIFKIISEYKLAYAGIIREKRELHAPLEAVFASIKPEELVSLAFHAPTIVNLHYEKLGESQENLKDLPKVISKALQTAQQKIRESRSELQEPLKRSILQESLVKARAEELASLTTALGRVDLKLSPVEMYPYYKAIQVAIHDIKTAEDAFEAAERDLAVIEPLLDTRTTRISQLEEGCREKKAAAENVKTALDALEQRSRTVDYERRLLVRQISETNDRIAVIDDAIVQTQKDVAKKHDLEKRIEFANKAKKLFTAYQRIQRIASQDAASIAQTLETYEKNKRLLAAAVLALSEGDIAEKQKKLDQAKQVKSEKEKDVDNTFTAYRETLEDLKLKTIKSKRVSKFESVILKCKKVKVFYQTGAGRGELRKQRYEVLEKKIEIALARMELNALKHARGQLEQPDDVFAIDRNRLALAKQTLRRHQAEEAWKALDIKDAKEGRDALLQHLNLELELIYQYYTSKCSLAKADRDTCQRKSLYAILNVILDRMHIAVSRWEKHQDLPSNYDCIAELKDQIENIDSTEAGEIFLKDVHGVNLAAEKSKEQGSVSKFLFGDKTRESIQQMTHIERLLKSLAPKDHPSKSKDTPSISKKSPKKPKDGSSDSPAGPQKSKEAEVRDVSFSQRTAAFLNAFNIIAPRSDSSIDHDSKNGYSYTPALIEDKLKLIQLTIDKPMRDEARFTARTEQYITDRDVHKRAKSAIKVHYAAKEEKFTAAKEVYRNAFRERQSHAAAKKKLQEEESRQAAARNSIGRKFVEVFSIEKLSYLGPSAILWFFYGLATRINPLLGFISLSYRVSQNILLMSSATHLFAQSFFARRDPIAAASPSREGPIDNPEEPALRASGDITLGTDQPITRIENGPVGYPNASGVNCYINASLQALFNIPEIRDRINEKKNDNDIAGAIEIVMNESNLDIIPERLERLKAIVFKRRNAKDFLAGPSSTERSQLMEKLKQEGQYDKQALSLELDQIDSSCQQDAQEFLTIILESLDCLPMETISYVKTSDGDTRPKVTRGNSIHISINNEPGMTFQKAIDRHFKGEKMVADGKKVEPFVWEDKGVKKTYSTYENHQRIKTLPPYLFVQLKRFSGRREKINDALPFPANGTLQIKHEKGSPADYEIVAYVNHHGSGIDGGHYTADIKNYKDPERSRRWIHCNDARLQVRAPVDPNNEAYIVVLKRKPKNEDIVSQLAEIH